MPTQARSGTIVPKARSSHQQSPGLNPVGKPQASGFFPNGGEEKCLLTREEPDSLKKKGLGLGEP